MIPCTKKGRILWLRSTFEESRSTFEESRRSSNQNLNDGIVVKAIDNWAMSMRYSKGMRKNNELENVRRKTMKV